MEICCGVSGLWCISCRRGCCLRCAGVPVDTLRPPTTCEAGAVYSILLSVGTIEGCRAGAEAVSIEPVDVLRGAGGDEISALPTDALRPGGDGLEGRPNCSTLRTELTDPFRLGIGEAPTNTGECSPPWVALLVEAELFVETDEPSLRPLPLLAMEDLDPTDEGLSPSKFDIPNPPSRYSNISANSSPCAI